jgi:hypothetical protein
MKYWKNGSILLVLIFLVFYNASNMFAGGSAEILRKIEMGTSELINREIVFDINKLFFGEHTLEIWLEPFNIEELRMPHEPIKIEYEVEMRQGEKIKERNVSYFYEDAEIGGSLFLYDIPHDFSWSNKGNLKIIIKNFVFDKTFTQYYKSIMLGIKRHSLFFR